MKILSWNINGIRSVKREKSLKSLFDSLDAEIICLQETKVTREMLEEETAIVEGYTSYFSFSKVRSGYSGVATFCRENMTPIKAEDKIYLPESNAESDSCNKEIHLTTEDIEALNAEGRAVLTEHLDSEGNTVVIVNLYCPRADLDNKERTQFKLKFYSLVQKKCKSLLEENKHVIVLGDFNVSHKLIDHCDPDDPEIFDSNPSRQWAGKFILDTSHDKLDDTNCKKFVDSFRFFHPHQTSAFTCWSTVTGARQTNYGTRIDYIFSSVNFFRQGFLDCVIRPDIEGSDHCPVVATLKTSFRNGGKPPPLCTKHMPEFAGKQQKLQAFFKKKEVQVDPTAAPEDMVKTTSSASNVVKVGKRPASECSNPRNQPKRQKTSNTSSQGNIFHFFSKKNVKGKTNSFKESPGVQDDKNRTDLCSDNENSSNDQEQDSGKSASQGSEFSSSQDSTPSSQSSSKKDSETVVAQWKNLLKGPPPAPPCSGHNETCVLRTVKNKGPNHGKQFYCCARPQGHSSNKEARCKFFKWVKK